MEFDWLDLLKLLAALLAGGLIGAERERSRKAVGLRTLVLISTGSALFTMLSMKISAVYGFDPARIAANIVTGIGFLGAGVILEERGRVTGLTTAATIWLSAALGMAAGMGQFVLLAITTTLSMLVLLSFYHIERLLASGTDDRTYTVTIAVDWEKFKHIRNMFKDQGMEITSHKQEKLGKTMVCTFEVWGPIKKHDKLTQKLLSDEDIKQCAWF
ncbi:MAG: MgtC/SapB family protein [Anaerolineaceae bacterium]|nr:MgtC/SapB family protein [Anaerolineaceae bacterium]MBN2676897.1 MgtC/SapB family protein [Anaerolineaceae bacterium]